MRKYLIGILIGVALTISTSVFAEDVISLIGSKIQGEFPVKINGTELDKPAIVINGTSYLPNRAIADALGMDITFDTELGITLNKKEGVETVTQTDETIEAPTETPVPDAYKNINFLNSSLDAANMALKSYEAGLKLEVDKDLGDGPKAVKYRELIDSVKITIADLEQKKAALTQ